MPNATNAFGLKPIRYASGAPYNGAFREYYATGATGALFIGDPVIANGTVNSTAIQGRAAGTLQQCQIALDGAGDPITGVVVGVLPVTADSLIYRANSTDRIIQVADDPDLVFIARANTGGTAFGVADSGLFANLATGSGGSTVTGISSWALDTGTPAASTVTFQVLLRNLYSHIENETGASAIWEVMINNHQLANVGDAGRFTSV